MINSIKYTFKTIYYFKDMWPNKTITIWNKKKIQLILIRIPQSQKITILNLKKRVIKWIKSWYNNHKLKILIR